MTYLRTAAEAKPSSPHCERSSWPAIPALIVLLLFSSSHLMAQQQDTATAWWTEYSAEQASGSDVLGFWKFDESGEGLTHDASSHDHAATVRGAEWSSDGRFGGCLESSAGYPVADTSHSIHVARSALLSPAGPFTVEMWIKGKDEDAFPASTRPMLLDSKYVPYDHTGFQLSLTAAGSDGSRQMLVSLGLGSRSEQWSSRAFVLKPGVWRHIAFTYDAAGTVTFYVDGAEMGRMTTPEAGSMAPASRPLSIGDRVGSLYNGFPGYLDEVRITRGERDFRPVRFESETSRFVFVRMDKRARIAGELVNQSGRTLSNATATVQQPDGSTLQRKLDEIAPGQRHPIAFDFDERIKPGTYEVALTIHVPGWGTDGGGYETTTLIPLVVTPRPLPHRMPVVMWGLGGTETVVREIPRLKHLGFTHCFGLRCDYQQIWDEGEDARPSTAENVTDGLEMLNTALENDVRIVAPLSPGSWLRRTEAGKPFLRVDRSGKPYARHDISGLFPSVQEFCYNTGAAMGRTYGEHPAFEAALLHTEVRGESQVSFHPEELKAYRKATGADVPAQVTIKNGVQYETLSDFPKDRVIEDDDPILAYLRWFWKRGDGWNTLNTRLHEGLHDHIERDNFWTFHDPAVRVPSIGGSGGEADYLAHWTYSYPDPVRIGLCTDELFEMARVNGHGQDVMKMTQVIWYRSQTAPENASPTGEPSPWVDQDPGAQYITIAPMHLREAFWWKIARPIKGIMYHGWQSLVPTDVPGAYRYTNANTQDELKRLIEKVVVPLGPTLLQVPDPPSDVAFLESFTSQMFARRGTYGWNHTWAGDAYHILMYAQLQPRVLYEESLLDGGLEGVKVLVMPDCDVLTRSVVDAIKQFQQRGGLVIADGEVCPAIRPDFVLDRFTRTKQADADRRKLQEAARDLRQWLDPRYARILDSTNPNVVTRRRRFATTDYLFAVNDHREYGSYVGNYDLVMEDGLPSDTTLRLQPPAGETSGFWYDLTAGREVTAVSPSETDPAARLPVHLGPCEGRLLMVTQRPIREVLIEAPEAARRGGAITIDIAITDGQSPIDAIIPLEVRIVDPEGVAAELTGFYGAPSGRLAIPFQFAPNDRTGLWQIQVKELASGRRKVAYLRLQNESEM